MVEGEPFGFDLVVGDPFVAGVEGGVFRVPFDFGEAEFVGDGVVELFAGGVFIVGKVIDPFEMVAQGVIDGGGAIVFMDHVGVMVP